MRGNIFDQYETTFCGGDLCFDIERKPKYILLIRILFFIIYHYFYLRYNRYGDSFTLFHIAGPYTEYDTFSISFLQHFTRKSVSGISYWIGIIKKNMYLKLRKLKKKFVFKFEKIKKKFVFKFEDEGKKERKTFLYK